MSHPHALLVLATAIFLLGSGLVIVALGWRRAFRGERSPMVIGQLTGRQRFASLAGIPAVGLGSIFGVAVIAAALR